MKNIGLIAILSFLVTDIILMPTHGAELHDSHANVRALGMGNAYISVVQDSEALFYNPAGLAKISGYYWKIMDLKAGVSGLTALDKLANMQTSNGFASAINELYGERLYIGGGAQTSVTTPFVSASLFYDANASFHVDSPSNPELTLNYMTDTGIVAGFGFHILPFFQMGLAIKSFTRTGVRKTYGLSDLGALDPAKFEADLNNSGTGLGLDVGLTLRLIRS